jgi:putative ABC transport system permease protein
LFQERAFRLVGLTRGVVSFTTIPVLFVSYNEVDQILMGTSFEQQTSFIVAKLKDSAQLASVLAHLRAALPDNDVYSRDEFVSRAVHYWTIQTGMGMAFFLTAILAVLIGGAIVGQTIYAGTIEHLRDYGTLKAIGAANADVNRIILSQATVSAALGFCVGVVISLAVQHAAGGAGVPMQLPWQLFATLFVVMVCTCLAAAYFSVRKVKTLDPVMVFRE